MRLLLFLFPLCSISLRLVATRVVCLVCGGESEGVAKTAAQKKRGRRNMPKVDNDARKLSNTDQFVGNSKTKTPKLCCLCSFVCFLCIDVICLLLFLPCVFPFLPPCLLSPSRHHELVRAGSGAGRVSTRGRGLSRARFREAALRQAACTAGA